jgi:hypothetical protein
MGKEIRFYNVMFPLWFLLIFPLSWLVVLPANFLIDSTVLLITLKLLKQHDIFISYKKLILKVWMFGFLSDFIGAGFMLLTQIDIFAGRSNIGFGAWWYNHIANPVAFNPFDNLYSLLYVVLVIIITAVFIYFFNLKYALKKMKTEIASKKQIALSLAIFTAPYILLFPSQILYK